MFFKPIETLHSVYWLEKQRFILRRRSIYRRNAKADTPFF
jgi:hypothetical protein